MTRPAHDMIPETALTWHRAGKGAALATVVQTWGSAPRPAGSQLAISGAGDIEGSVSGGCVEGAVVAEAQEAMDEGCARIVEYGVSDENAFAVGLACGGTIRVLIEPVGRDLPVALLSELVARREGREGVAYVVDTDTWERHLVGPQDAGLAPELAARFAAGKSGFEGARFVAIHNPPLRMAVVGAVHVAQPLVQMAQLTGFDTTLIDPREAFAAPARFPGQQIVTDWPDAALADHGLDAHTAVVTLTHDPKLDDPALMAALRSDVFYIGALGSHRTHDKRVARLAQAGFTAEQIARVHGPVGLAIGAQTPAEIAVSIMAQVVQILRKGRG